MKDSLYVVEPTGDHSEAARAIRISLLGVTRGKPATFLPDKSPDIAGQWKEWIDEWFLPVLAPKFLEVHQLASQFHIEEVAGVDLDLDRVLPNQLRSRSMQSASRLMEGNAEMKHHPEWARFVSRVERGELPGHALTLLALRSVLYHLALVPALTSYAWFEFHSGLSGCGIQHPDDKTELFLKIAPHLQLALPGGTDDRCTGDTVDGSGNSLHTI